MKQIKDFEEFDHNNYHITTDLGSALFHFESGILTIQGHAYGDDKRQIEVILEPEDTADFNVSVSASDGELTSQDLKFKAKLFRVEDIETEETL